MAKKLPQQFYDASLDWVRSTMTRMAICSAEPANYSDISSVTLAEVVMAPADFTLANGDVGGRKVTIAAKNSIPIGTSGSATHIVLHDNTSTLGPVTVCPATPLNSGSGNTVNSAAWKIEIDLGA